MEIIQASLFFFVVCAPVFFLFLFIYTVDLFFFFFRGQSCLNECKVERRGLFAGNVSASCV